MNEEETTIPKTPELISFIIIYPFINDEYTCTPLIINEESILNTHF